MNGSDMVRYFAYGNNMLTQVLTESIPSARPMGFGRLADHRLAFTHESGAVNIAACSGLWVYGALYSIDKDKIPQLDQKEGVPIEYERVTHIIRTVEGPVDAMTYVAVRTEAEEVSPDPAYLEQIINGAQEHKLPKAYRDFLEYLKTQFSLGNRNEGLLLTPTTDRRFSAGEPLIRLNPADKGSVENKKFGVMFQDGRKHSGRLRLLMPPQREHAKPTRHCVHPSGSLASGASDIVSGSCLVRARCPGGRPSDRGR